MSVEGIDASGTVLNVSLEAPPTTGSPRGSDRQHLSWLAASAKDFLFEEGERVRGSLTRYRSQGDRFPMKVISGVIADNAPEIGPHFAKVGCVEIPSQSIPSFDGASDLEDFDEELFEKVFGDWS